MDNNESLSSNLKTAKDKKYLKFPKTLMILWIIVLVFTLVLTIFSIMMLTFDIAYNIMQSIYMENGGTYEGYTIQELITPSGYDITYYAASWYGTTDHLAIGFHYNDSRLPDDSTPIDIDISLNQYIATQILMIYPDLYLSAAGYPVSDGPGTYGYEFANLFYNWLKYATNTDNDIFHSASNWDSTLGLDPGSVLYAPGGSFAGHNPVWSGDSIYSIFGLTSSAVGIDDQSYGTAVIFYIWSTPAIFDFWYQDWWNSDYFNYDSSVPTVYYDYDSYTYGEMDKQIIDSLRTWMPATSGYTTFNLFPSGFASGDQITNLADNSLSNNVYIVFQQEESVLNPTNINNTDSIWLGSTHTAVMFDSMDLDSKSSALSIIQTLLILISLVLIIFVFTPWYQINQKTFRTLNLIIPIVLIITIILMLINYSFWANFNNNFEAINDVKIYDSFVSSGPDNVVLSVESWDLMFHYYSSRPITVSLTVDQFTNNGVYSTIMGTNSLSFQTARLYKEGSAVGSYAVVGSFEFAFGINDKFISGLNALNTVSFLNYLLGRIFTYLIMIIIICLLIAIFVYSIIFKEVQITLYYNEMKSTVDKKITQMNKTTDKLTKTKEKYDK